MAVTLYTYCQGVQAIVRLTKDKVWTAFFESLCMFKSSGKIDSYMQYYVLNVTALNTRNHITKVKEIEGFILYISGPKV